MSSEMVWHVIDPMEANVSLQQKMGRQVVQDEEGTEVVGLGDFRDGIHGKPMRIVSREDHHLLKKKRVVFLMNILFLVIYPVPYPLCSPILPMQCYPSPY